MTVGFEPSDEMIEAGARALCETASDGIDNYDDLDDVAQEMFREWSEANLRAALGLVLSDPCPTCGGRGWVDTEGGVGYETSCRDCCGHAPHCCCDACRKTIGKVPVWAWLRAAQNSGVMEQVGWVVDGGTVDPSGQVSVFGAGRQFVTANAPYMPDARPVFRVSVPSTPEES